MLSKKNALYSLIFLIAIIMIFLGKAFYKEPLGNIISSWGKTSESPSISLEVPAANQEYEDSQAPSSMLTRNEQSQGLEITSLDKVGEPKLGHFPYSIANSDSMHIICSYAQGERQRFEKLLPEAAQSLMKLIYSARDDGLWIIPVSAFRDFSRQENLFGKQVEKRGSSEAAARVSAPPGYSEHHTGYAVDLTDGRFPGKDITLEFAETEAFQWLQQHASEFGFELSFPEDNVYGVSFEPWHWRFVGSQEAKTVFIKARK